MDKMVFRKLSNLPQKKTMLIKTLLNKVERFKSFVYGSVCVMLVGGPEALVIDIEPRRNNKPICPECSKPGTIYDRQPQRLFEYIPILSFKAFFRYTPRRIKCPEHGVKVIAKKALQSLNVLDRFHIMRKFNEAIDEIRRSEVKQLKAEGQQNVLERKRWLLLKRPENLSEKQTARMGEMLKLNLTSIKGYLLREDFQRFWEYQRYDFAEKFLENWVPRTLQTDL